MSYSEPGIFNVVEDFISLDGGITYLHLIANNSSTTIAQQNTKVLRGIIALAQANCDNASSKRYGAIILFPGHSVVPSPVGPGGTDVGGRYYFCKPIDDTDSSTPTIPIDCNWPIRFLGTGNATLSIVANDDGTIVDFFGLTTNATGLGDNTGGMTFEDLTFTYPDVTETGGSIPEIAAIHTIPTSDSTMGGARCVRAIRCVFNDCPIGVWFEEALECAIEDCTFLYAGNSGIAIRLGNGINPTDGASAKEIFISRCLFNAKGTDWSTAIQILGSDHVRVDNCHIDSFLNGILIVPGYGKNALRHTFTNVCVYTSADNVVDSTTYVGHACLLQGQQSGGDISQIVFTSCYFELGENASPTTTVPGVLVDGSISTIDTVRFVSCHSLRWPGPGLEIIGGDGVDGPANIEVLGGMYSGNLYSDESFTSSDAYGIHIGKSTGVRVSGTSCVGEYSYITEGGAPGSSPQQSNGIFVDANAAGVVVSGCDLRNNSETGVTVVAGASDIVIDACDVRANGTNGVKIDGSTGAVSDAYVRNCNATGYGSYSTAIDVAGSTANVQTVEVTNCSGYNDRGQILATSPAVASGVAFHSYTFGYWGPVEFYAANAVATITSIKFASTTLPPKSGSFLLMPGENATVTWSPSPSTIGFVAIGK